ncbi:hypothetical protein F4679DRAFT_591328 [Xylaria curta]|nr:hypothetical protein F4679DRAFT_591328 [Xylaria curta]
MASQEAEPSASNNIPHPSADSTGPTASGPQPNGDAPNSGGNPEDVPMTDVPPSYIPLAQPRARRGRQTNTTASPKPNRVPGDDAPFKFFQTRDLDDIPQIDMRNTGNTFTNMRTLPDNLNWWEDDFKYQLPGSDHVTQEDREFHARNINAQHIPGQTFMYTYSTSNRAQEETAAAACFSSSVAYCTFSDTDGRDFFGPFLMAKKDYNYGGVAFQSWDDVPRALIRAHDNPPLHSLLVAVSNNDTLRSYLVRQGDITPDYPEDKKRNMHIVATILATALAYLKLAVVRFGSREPRFPKATDEQLAGEQKGHYYYGYHADHWVSALALVSQALSRFTKGKAISFRGPGRSQKEKSFGMQLARVTSADLSRRVKGVMQQANRAEEVCMQNLKFSSLVNAPVPEPDYLPPGPDSSDDSMGEGDDDDDPTRAVKRRETQQRRQKRQSTDTLFRRMDHRLKFLINSGDKQERWMVKNIAARSRQAKSKGQAQRNDATPPISDATMAAILKDLEPNFITPRAYTMDGASADAFAKITNGADLNSFVAQQESHQDAVLTLRSENKDMDHEEARKEVDRLNKQAFIMTSALDADPPHEVDFVDATASAGLKDWQNLELNPAGAPGMKLKPHQIADAYLLRQMEESITKGGILANNVGTGKTVIMFLVVYLHLLELRKQKAEGKKIDALPTLVIVPAAIVVQVYQDFVKFFHGLLDIHIVYGRPLDYPQGGIREATLTGARWEQEMEKRMSDRRNPDNAMHVYVTAPFTAHRRYLSKKTFMITKKDRQRGFAPPPDTVGYVGDDDPDFADPAWLAGNSGKRAASKLSRPSAKRQKLSAKAKGKRPTPSQDVTDSEQENDSEDQPDTDQDSEDDVEQLKEELEREDPPYDNGANNTVDPDTAVGQHTSFRLKMCKRKDLIFGRLIVDEAHCLRNPNSQLTRMVDLIPKQRLLLVTATPIVAGKHDFRGPLRLFQGLARLPICLDKDPDYALRSDFDPDPEKCKALSSFWTDESPTIRDRCVEFYRQTGIYFWVLDTEVANVLRRPAHDATTDVVYNHARHLLQTRRHMKTPLTMPDGSKTFPGQQVPPMHVTFEEVGYRGEDGRTVSAVSTFVSKMLYTKGSKDGHIPDYVDGEAPKGEVPRLNYNLSRYLVICTLFIYATTIFGKEDTVSRLNFKELHKIIATKGHVDDVEAVRRRKKEENEHGNVEPKLNNKANAIEIPGAGPTKASAEKAAEKKRTQAPVFGVDHVERLVEEDPDGGLTYLWSLCHDRGTLPPVDRASMVYWLLSRSPSLHRAVYHILKNIKKGKKTLVMLDNHYCQQLLVSIIAKMGIGVGSARASDQAKARTAAIARFNDPKDDMMVFVCNANVDLIGTNFHGACADGIMLQYPQTITMAQQAFGRLDRLGQLGIIHWTIIHVINSYHDIQDSKQTSRFVEVLRNQALIPEYIKEPDLRRIVAYEIARSILSHPFNRYTWYISPPNLADEFNTDRHRKYGAFYSWIAQLLVGIPDEYKNDDFFKHLNEHLSGIAKRWVANHDAYTNLSFEERLAKLLHHIQRHQDSPDPGTEHDGSPKESRKQRRRRRRNDPRVKLALYVTVSDDETDNDGQGPDLSITEQDMQEAADLLTRGDLGEQGTRAIAEQIGRMGLDPTDSYKKWQQDKDEEADDEGAE